MHRIVLLAVALTAFLTRAGRSQEAAGPLVVYNAGSLAKPVRELLHAFQRMHPAVEPAQENSGSLEAARKLTDLDKVPDVLAVADYGVIPKLLVPAHASWYALFARSEMVLAHAEGATGAAELTSESWWHILLRPGVRTGHSDPSLDPAGYRALMVYQLAGRHYRQPGLAARLTKAVPARYVRPKSADLVALLQAGELDYAWEYEAVARQRGLRYLKLPREINLGDPTLADAYAHARVRVRGARQVDSVEFQGEPIVYALTIPLAAPHPAAAAAFVRFVVSAEGQEVMRSNGFIPLAPAQVAGPGKPPPGLF